jgi:hypothetical protein
MTMIKLLIFWQRHGMARSSGLATMIIKNWKLKAGNHWPVIGANIKKKNWKTIPAMLYIYSFFANGIERREVATFQRPMKKII